MSTRSVNWNGASAVAIFGGCGCDLEAPVGTASGDVQLLDRCPMHEAAPAMLEALETAQRALFHSPSTEAVQTALGQTRHAIAQAKGEA